VAAPTVECVPDAAFMVGSSFYRGTEARTATGSKEELESFYELVES